MELRRYRTEVLRCSLRSLAKRWGMSHSRLHTIEREGTHLRDQALQIERLSEGQVLAEEAMQLSQRRGMAEAVDAA